MKHKCEICGKYSKFMSYYPAVSFTNDDLNIKTEYMSAEFLCVCGNIQHIRMWNII